MNKLWNWIWYSPDWYWTNTITGEKKDSTAFLKATCLIGFVLCLILPFIIYFG